MLRIMCAAWGHIPQGSQHLCHAKVMQHACWHADPRPVDHRTHAWFLHASCGADLMWYGI